MGKLQLGNRIIDEDLGVILNTLKSELRNGKLKDIKCKGDNYLVSCPFHKNGFESHASCGVFCGDDKELEFGTFHCFSCGESGSLPQFVGQCFERDETYGREWLILHFGNIITENFIELEPIELNSNTQDIESRDVDISKFLDYHPYMDKRKITEQVRDEFSIKYNPTLQTIVFPVWDENNNLVMLTQRSVNTKQFIIDAGVTKPVYLFNRVKDKNYPFVIITEAQIDALTCWGYGVPACAFIGLGSDKQYEILNRNRIKCWVTIFDNDQAGRDATIRFNKLIRKDEFVVNIQLPKDKKDINELSYEEFNELLNTNNLTWRLPFIEI